MDTVAMGHKRAHVRAAGAAAGGGGGGGGGGGAGRGRGGGMADGERGSGERGEWRAPRVDSVSPAGSVAPCVWFVPPSCARSAAGHPGGRLVCLFMPRSRAVQPIRPVGSPVLPALLGTGQAVRHVTAPFLPDRFPA